MYFSAHSKALRAFMTASVCSITLVSGNATAIDSVSELSAAICGPLENFGTGPWDYFDPENRMATGSDPMGRVKRVENVHFRREFENLDRRYGIERLTSEVFYTLRAFPNHPRALWAMSRLERLAGGKLPRIQHAGMVPQFSADCFFERAFRFNGDYGPVWMIYGMHSHQKGRLAEASRAYAKAEEMGEDDGQFHYNYALLLVDLKEWAKAKEHASLAYAAGVSFPALKEKLKKAGHTLE